MWCEFRHLRVSVKSNCRIVFTLRKHLQSSCGYSWCQSRVVGKNCLRRKWRPSDWWKWTTGQNSSKCCCCKRGHSSSLDWDDRLEVNFNTSFILIKVAHTFGLLQDDDGCSLTLMLSVQYYCFRLHKLPVLTRTSWVCIQHKWHRSIWNFNTIPPPPPVTPQAFDLIKTGLFKLPSH